MFEMLLNPAVLFLLLCVTGRVAYMVVHEDGPFHIFAWMRTHLPHGGLLDCQYCASVWTGTAAATLYLLGEHASWLRLILLGLAFSGLYIGILKVWDIVSSHFAPLFTMDDPHA